MKRNLISAVGGLTALMLAASSTFGGESKAPCNGYAFDVRGSSAHAVMDGSVIGRESFGNSENKIKTTTKNDVMPSVRFNQTRTFYQTSNVEVYSECDGEIRRFIYATEVDSNDGEAMKRAGKIHSRISQANFENEKELAGIPLGNGDYALTRIGSGNKAIYTTDSNIFVKEALAKK